MRLRSSCIQNFEKLQSKKPGSYCESIISDATFPFNKHYSSHSLLNQSRDIYGTDTQSDFDRSTVLDDNDDLMSIDSINCDSDSVTSLDNRSVFSLNSYVTAQTDLDYQSSILRPQKRFKSSFNESSLDIIDKQNEDPKRFKVLSLHSCIWLLGICALLSLIIVLAGIFLLFLVSLCEKQSQNIISLDYTKSNLSQCLIGQEKGIDLIIHALGDYFKSDSSEKMYVLSIIGPVGVGKTLTKHTIINTLPSGVSIYEFSNILSLESSLDQEMYKLVNKLDYCKPNVVFVDGIDDNFGTISRFIKQLNFYIKDDKSILLKHVHRKVLFVLFGSYKSNHVTSSFYNHINSGSLRKDFNLEGVINPFSEINELNDMVWTVVPFLPLQEYHLNQCVIQTLNLIAGYKSSCSNTLNDNTNTFLSDKNIKFEDIIVETSKLSLNAQRFEDILPFGCKRVYHIVSSIVLRS